MLNPVEPSILTHVYHDLYSAASGAMTMNESERAGKRIGDRLREVARLLYDGNKSELARALEMKPSSFGKYIRGTRRPGASVLERLTRLGVNVDWLLTGEGPILLESASSQRSSHAPREDVRSGHTRPPQRKRSMSAAELSNLDPAFHPIPVVKPRLKNGTLQLEQVGEPEWISAQAIQSDYGGSPDRLRTFVVASDRMAPTIRPGERARGVLLRSPVPPTAISNGAVYLVRSMSRIWVTRLHRTQAGEANPDDTWPENGHEQNEPGGSDDRDEEILLCGDNPEASDKALSLEEWSAEFRIIAQLIEVTRSL